MCPSGTTAAAARRQSDLLQAFNVLDADRDGKISKDDLRRTFSSSSSLSSLSSSSDEAITTMISLADSDNDGYVQFHEFQQVLNKGQRKSRNVGGSISGVMEEAFKVMDRDGDGRLGVDDLREFLGMGGVAVSEEEAREMMRLGGRKAEEDGVDIETLLRILGIRG